MKRVIFLSITASILVLSLYAFTGTMTNTKKVDNEVKLMNRSVGTRSATTTEIEAFVDDSTLTVTFEDYSGMAWVEVAGPGGMRQCSAGINGSGCIRIGLSSLPKGTYLLRVTLENALYEGNFER